MADAHLETLFSDGSPLTINYPGKPEISLWITRPNVVQQKDILKKARAAKARRKQELLNKGGDERLALDLEVEDLHKSDLVKRLVEQQAQSFMQQATNEVMFNPEVGSDWGEEAEDYLAIVDAIIVRLNEIQDHNKSVEESGQDDQRILPTDDEELVRLSAEQERFNEEVQKRFNELTQVREREVGVRDTDELRKEYRQHRIEQECDMAWFEEYRQWQIYYACRYDDDHNKLYFSRADKILGLPPSIRTQIFNAYDGLEVGGEDVKNLLTSLSS
jgi:hypothetical protein